MAKDKKKEKEKEKEQTGPPTPVDCLTRINNSFQVMDCFEDNFSIA
jgi:hypothetical protein